MQLVINIPEQAYKLLQSEEGVDWLGAEHILDAVANGKPLETGQWIDIGKPEYDDNGNLCIFSKCSECGEMTSNYSNYCPNCGVKMEAMQNERSSC